MTATVDILLTIPSEQAKRYHSGLVGQPGFTLQIVHTMDDALEILGDKDNHVDVFVIDQALGDTFFFLNRADVVKVNFQSPINFFVYGQK
ncbi:MAG TPA: hypothetical protein PLZ51_07740 [Aggregatilineales bacterium]|nr:hypothetical protein [Aggregatilineales bacterium]